MKNFKILLSLIFLFSNNVYSQIKGGERKNYETTPQEVKPSKITHGEVSSDVNLFNGSLSSSYNLGSVSTECGLSFGLKMNYTSSYSFGDVMPCISGVPYGENWNLNIPTISISNESFSKEPQQKWDYYNYVATQFDGTILKPTPPFNGPADNSFYYNYEARKEGALFWFSPQINVPGCSGRFVYKYHQMRSENGEMFPVFVPYSFDNNSYAEARLIEDGTVWEVHTSDGTIYRFELKTAVTGVRNSSNKRLHYGYIEGSTANNQDLLTDLTSDKSVMDNLLLPKKEILTWYCTSIRKPNCNGGQKIEFNYQKYGQFNYFKEFKQTSMAICLRDFLDLTNQSIEGDENIKDEVIHNDSKSLNIDNFKPNSNFNFNTFDYQCFKDIYLTSIIAKDEFREIEELELNYSSNFSINTLNYNQGVDPNTPIRNFADFRNTSTTFRVDSLYTGENVFSYGLDNSNDRHRLLNGITTSSSVSNTDFSGWRKYAHAKYNLGNTLTGMINQLNLGSKCTNPYIAQGMLRYKTLINSAGNTLNRIDFNHSFLESPKLSMSYLIPGEIYELKTLINAPVGVCSYDVNIVTGESQSFKDPNGPIIYQDPSDIDNIWHKLDGLELSIHDNYRKTNLFTTFNQPIKWTTGNFGSDGLLVTSNLFSPSNYSTNLFGSFYVQIGPSNSDHYFNMHSNPSLDLNTTQYLDGNNNSIIKEGATNGQVDPMKTYVEDIKDWTGTSANGTYYSDDLKPFQPIPMNFGVGLPWFMVRNLYTSPNSAMAYFGGVVQFSNSTSKPFYNTYQNWWNEVNPITSMNFRNLPTQASYISGQTENSHSLEALVLLRYGKNPYMLTSIKKYRYEGNIVKNADGTIQNRTLTSQIAFTYNTAKLEVNDNTVLGNPSTSALPVINYYLRTVYLLHKIIEVPVSVQIDRNELQYFQNYLSGGTLTGNNSTLQSQSQKFSTYPTITFYYEKQTHNMEDYDNLTHKYDFNPLAVRFYNPTFMVLNSIVDAMGMKTSYTYYNSSKDLISNINISGESNSIVNVPKKLLSKSFCMVLSVKEKKIDSESTLPKIWSYYYLGIPSNNYVNAYGIDNLITSQSNFNGNSSSYSIGYAITKVVEPAVSVTNRVYREYFHHILEPNSSNHEQSLLFGKLFRIDTYNENNFKTNTKKIDFKTNQAYYSGIKRIRGSNILYFKPTCQSEANGYLNPSFSYDSDPQGYVNIRKQFPSEYYLDLDDDLTLSDNCRIKMQIDKNYVSYFGETCKLKEIPNSSPKSYTFFSNPNNEPYLNSYFVTIDKETDVEYTIPSIVGTGAREYESPNNGIYTGEGPIGAIDGYSLEDWGKFDLTDNKTSKIVNTLKGSLDEFDAIKWAKLLESNKNNFSIDELDLLLSKITNKEYQFTNEELLSFINKVEANFNDKLTEIQIKEFTNRINNDELTNAELQLLVAGLKETDLLKQDNINYLSSKVLNNETLTDEDKTLIFNNISTQNFKSISKEEANKLIEKYQDGLLTNDDLNLIALKCIFSENHNSPVFEKAYQELISGGSIDKGNFSYLLSQIIRKPNLSLDEKTKSKLDQLSKNENTYIIIQDFVSFICGYFQNQVESFSRNIDSQIQDQLLVWHKKLENNSKFEPEDIVKCWQLYLNEDLLISDNFMQSDLITSINNSDYSKELASRIFIENIANSNLTLDEFSNHINNYSSRIENINKDELIELLQNCYGLTSHNIDPSLITIFSNPKERIANQWTVYDIISRLNNNFSSGNNVVARTIRDYNIDYQNAKSPINSNSYDGISSVKEFTYWEANRIGKTKCEGYKKLIPGLGIYDSQNNKFTINDINAEYQLVYEPSWQIHKTKSYSYEMPGAYSEVESFFFHDLKNLDGFNPWIYSGQNNLSLVNSISYYTNDPGTFFDYFSFNDRSHFYNFRDIKYEERITGKALNKLPESFSTYFNYDSRWDLDPVNVVDQTINEPGSGNCQAPPQQLPINTANCIHELEFSESLTGPPSNNTLVGPNGTYYCLKWFEPFSQNIQELINLENNLPLNTPQWASYSDEWTEQNVFPLWCPCSNPNPQTINSPNSGNGLNLSNPKIITFEPGIVDIRVSPYQISEYYDQISHNTISPLPVTFHQNVVLGSNPALGSNPVGLQMNNCPDPQLYNLSNNFLLRSIVRQADVVNNGLTIGLFSSSNTDYPILRFAQVDNKRFYSNEDLEINYDPVYPFDTLVELEILSWNHFSQLHLKRDEKGLITRFQYDNNFSRVYHKYPIPTCDYTETIFNHPGKPSFITIGSNYSYKSFDSFSGTFIPSTTGLVFDSLNTNFEYDNNGAVKKIIDPNGLVQEYNYDDYHRLTQIIRNGNTLKLFNYHNWQNDESLSFDSRAFQNYTDQFTLSHAGSYDGLFTRSFSDPIGRNLVTASQKRTGSNLPGTINPNSYVISASNEFISFTGKQVYDEWDRVINNYRPTGNLPTTPISDIDEQVCNNIGLFSNAFQETRYENNLKNRPLKKSDFGMAINGSNVCRNNYSIINFSTLIYQLNLSNSEINMYLTDNISQVNNQSAYKFRVVESVDQDNKQKFEYTNALGQKIAEKSILTSNNFVITLYNYNSLFYLSEVINPLKQTTSYFYNTLGWQYKKQAPDNGTVSIIFNRSGKPYLMQDMNGISGAYNTNFIHESNNLIYHGTYPYYLRYEYDIFGNQIAQIRESYPQTGYSPLSFNTIQNSGSNGLGGFQLFTYQTNQITGNSTDGKPMPDYNIVVPTSNSQSLTCNFDYGQTCNWLFNVNINGVAMPLSYLVDYNYNLPDKFEKRYSYNLSIGNSERKIFNNYSPNTNTLNGYYGLVSNQTLLNYDLNDKVTKRFINRYFFKNYTNLFAVINGVNTNIQNNLLGKLAFEIAYNEFGRAIHNKFYSYNEDGFLEFELQNFDENGVSNSINKYNSSSTVGGILVQNSYPSYTFSGKPMVENSEILLTPISSTINNTYSSYKYEYDVSDRIVNVYAKEGITNNYVRIVNYEYNQITGLLEKTNHYGGNVNSSGDFDCAGNSILKQYDIRDRLQSNSSYLFNEIMYYDDNGGTSMNFNGNINSVLWNYHLPSTISSNFSNYPNFSFGSYDSYDYAYDNLNRLTNSVHYGSQVSNTFSNGVAIGSEAFEYDKIGNILELSRNEISDAINSSQIPTVNIYNYNYAVGNNRLLHVNRRYADALPIAVSTNNSSMDYNFSYDPNGNAASKSFSLTAGSAFVNTPSFISNQHLYNIEYNSQNLPISINSKADKYLYNNHDLRIFKKTGNLASTNFPNTNSCKNEFYLINCFGNTISIISYQSNETSSVESETITITNGETWHHVFQHYLQTVISPVSGSLGIQKYVFGNGREAKINSISNTISDCSFYLTDHLGSTRVTYRLFGNQITSSTSSTVVPVNLVPLNYTGAIFKDSRFVNFIGIGANQSITSQSAPIMIAQACTTNIDIQSLYDYYPSGKILRSYESEAAKYKFTTKERDDETGLDYFGARLYDSDIMRWLQVDPMSDFRESINPFNYCQNNPLNILDPTGKLDNDGVYINSGGKEIGKDNNDDKNVYQVQGVAEDIVTENSNKNLTTDLSSLNPEQVFLAPTYQERQIMGDNCLKEGTNDQTREYATLTSGTPEKLQQLTLKATEVSKSDGTGHIDLLQGGRINVNKSNYVSGSLDGGNIRFSAHTHTGNVNDWNQISAPTPSDKKTNSQFMGGVVFDINRTSVYLTNTSAKSTSKPLSFPSFFKKYSNE